MMMKRALQTLTRPEFEISLREALTSWGGADADTVSRTVAWVRHMREDLVALLRAVDDDEQVGVTLAVNYIELKSRWIALNTKVNYQTFRTGSCDPEVACRGTGCSMLLAELETLLTPDDVEKIAEFLAQPVSRAA